MSDDKDNEFSGDGLAEELLNLRSATRVRRAPAGGPCLRTRRPRPQQACEPTVAWR